MRKKKQKLCAKCRQKPAVINFCNDCAREISRHYEHGMMMERMQAAVAYCNNTPRKNKRLEVAAVLSIIRPEMSMDKIVEITRAVEE